MLRSIKSDYNANKSIVDSLKLRLDSLNSRLEVLDSIEKNIPSDIVLSQIEFLKRAMPNHAN